MGQRSRKRARGASAGGQDTADALLAPPVRRGSPTAAPPPPWAPFPLAELAILGGAIAIVAGLIWGTRRGLTLTVCGGALASAGALEVAVREHLSGYRSHSALLALAGAVLTIVVLWVFVPVPGSPNTQWAVAVGGAVVVFVASLAGWRELFRRRSGGLTFRA